MTSRLIRVAIAGACVLGGTCFWFGSPLKAQTDEDFGSFREAYSERPTSEQKTVRLRYLGATWDRVLKDFAKQTGRELVMDAYPQGRVTRRDGTAYTVPEALRLLNSELENDGYRLLLQREHIVVLKLDNARSRYSRPVASKTSEAPKSKPAPLRSRTTNRPDYEVARKSRPTIRRISGYQQTPRAQAPVEEQTFEIANAKAADVARSIYEVFATRSTLNKSGVRGLPSFTVYHRSENGDVTNREHFEIGIDRANNALTVAAPANSIRQLINLIRELDQAPRELAKQNVKVVETENVKAKTTDELQRELNRMTRGVRTSFSPNRDNMFFAQNSQDGNTPAPSAPQTGSEDPRSMNLQGDVVLQPLDDIGAVVIKGNQADIDTVVGIIEELEELSKGTLPDINLVELKSVNSEALAELLTSVYENLTELREAGTGTGNERKNNIGFVPVVKPNAILVLAPQVEMEAIQNLINKLDRPVNPTYEFEVFQLKHAIASQVVASLTSLTEEPTGLATRIRAVADVRTNSVIVQARPTDLELVAALIQKVDQDKAGKSSRLKVIKLRNAVAEELAETIQTAIQNIINPPQTNVNFGQTGSSELRDSQSVVLEFFTRDGDIERLLRSGILVDVRVQADIRTNSLLVTAPEPSLELMEALIKELDGVPRSVADIKVFSLERADATQAVELLTGLFEDQNNQDETGIAIAGADTAESTLVPLRFSADVRTNTVVA
ncbi:MAG: secretin N-terminal domain-containing protein, partial [Planctomycetaceae bacterium]